MLLLFEKTLEIIYESGNFYSQTRLCQNIPIREFGMGNIGLTLMMFVAISFCIASGLFVLIQMIKYFEQLKNK